jgi:phosphoesterase RecJ-like protein
VNIELYQNEPLEKIKLHNQVFSTLEIYRNTIGIVTLDDTIKEEFDHDINTDGIVEYVRNIDEIEVAIFIKQLQNKELKVSMRSKNTYDVSAIALNFGGGGHKNAAGFSYNGTIKQCIDDILKAMK